MKLSLALDEEFRRVAQEEDVPMGDLVAEVAKMLGCSERMIYNYRSGKWSIPSSFLSPLCKRFRSPLLFEVLAEPIKREGSVFTEADLDIASIRERSKDLVLTSVEHFHLIESVLKSGNLSKADLQEIEESGERIGLRFRHVLSLLEFLYERQTAPKKEQA
jgi:transcriptional regulator with XRE-family HTH domain